MAYASAVGPDGAIYVGTGNEGTVCRVTADGAKVFADTDAAGHVAGLGEQRALRGKPARRAHLSPSTARSGQGAGQAGRCGSRVGH